MGDLILRITTRTCQPQPPGAHRGAPSAAELVAGARDIARRGDTHPLLPTPPGAAECGYLRSPCGTKPSRDRPLTLARRFGLADHLGRGAQPAIRWLVGARGVAVGADRDAAAVANLGFPSGRARRGWLHEGVLETPKARDRNG
jgi:hypothetical protein